MAGDARLRGAVGELSERHRLRQVVPHGAEYRRAHQHRELAHAHEELRQVATELRSVSQRLVRLEEQGQRELAGEIEYELGQAIHALGTRISLAFRDTRDEHMVRLLESLE